MSRIGTFFRELWSFVERLLRLLRMLLNRLIVKPLHELGSPLLRLVLRIFQLLFFTLNDMGRNRTNLRTASLSFYTLLSIIPLLAVLFAVAKTMGYIDLLLESLYGLFPQIPEIIDYGINFAERTLARTRGGWMAVVAGLMVLWSAVSLMDDLVQAFNDTWQVRERRSIGRYGAYLLILILFPTLWAGSEVLGHYLSDLFNLNDHWILRIMGDLVSTTIELGLFVVAYKVIPHTRVEWKSALVAGVTAGVVFQIFHWFFTTILTEVTSYNAIYGSFAALPMFLFWLRYSWQILLTGNELAYAHQNLNLLREERLNR